MPKDGPATNGPTGNRNSPSRLQVEPPSLGLVSPPASESSVLAGTPAQAATATISNIATQRYRFMLSLLVKGEERLTGAPAPESDAHQARGQRRDGVASARQERQRVPEQAEHRRENTEPPACLGERAGGEHL